MVSSGEHGTTLKGPESRFSWRRATGTVAAVLALSLTTACSSETAGSTNEAPASAPADPTSTEQASGNPENSADISFTPLDASELKNPEALKATLGEIFTISDMAGANPEWAKKFDITKFSPNEYATQRVDSYFDNFVETYYLNPDSDQKSLEAIEQKRISAIQTLEVYILSLTDDPENIAPYERLYTVTEIKVIPSDKSSGTIQYVVNAEDNRQSNVGQHMLQGENENISLDEHNSIRYVVVNGYILFTHHDISSNR